MRVARHDVTQIAASGGEGQLIDERRRRREGRIEAILDGAIGDGDRQVRLAGPAGAAEDEGVAPP